MSIIYETDVDGKWEVRGNVRLLVEPSEEYLQKLEIQRQQELEEKLLESLIPSSNEILKAEIDLQVLQILKECELI